MALIGKVKLHTLVCLFLACCCHAQADWQTDTRPIMGTEISVTLWHKSAAKRAEGFAAVFNEMERINQAYSPYIDTSELSEVNRLAATEPVAISEELALLINRANQVSELSDGAFDITYASLGRFYDYRKKQQPTNSETKRYLKAINFRYISLVNNTLRFTHPHVYIDLGGIAKGYAVDQSIDVLSTLGFTHASVSAGGDSRLLGDKRGRPWMIGIKHPRSQTDIALTLPISNAAISTSGDYERYFINNQGARIHHIHQPKTGKPTQGISSVTIIGNKGLQADPLSTAVFVLGAEKGLALVDQLSEVEAIVITEAGKVHYSDGLGEPE